MTTIIIDYGMGNLRSVQKAFERIGEPAIISSHAATIAAATRVVLPGVGAFQDAIAALRQHDLIGVMGKPMEIPLKLARAQQLTGPVEVELIVDPRLTGLVWAEPLLLNEKATGAMLKVHAKADPRLLGIWNLSAKAKAKRNGFPVISETAFEVEWVAAPK